MIPPDPTGGPKLREALEKALDDMQTATGTRPTVAALGALLDPEVAAAFRELHLEVLIVPSPPALEDLVEEPPGPPPPKPGARNRKCRRPLVRNL